MAGYETHVFEAEDMAIDGVNWRVADDDEGWWYTGAPSRGKMLQGSFGAQANATHSVTIGTAGAFNVWVRYADNVPYRGPFTVTLSQNGVIKGTQTYDTATLHGPGDPAGQAKWGGDYADWVWVPLQVQLDTGPVDIAMSKAGPIVASWVARLVDCFVISNDPNYVPTIADFAVPLYLKVRMDAQHPEPCVIHMWGRFPRGPQYYLEGINFYNNQVVDPQYYTGYNPSGPNPTFLVANQESPWFNIGPHLLPVNPHVLWFNAILEYDNNLSDSKYSVILSTTPSDAGIVHQFSRTGTGDSMLVRVDPRHVDQAKGDLELSQSDRAAANFPVKRPAAFPIFTGCSIGSRYQPTTASNEIQTLINLGYDGTTSNDPLLLQNGFTKIAAMTYVWGYWYNNCMSDLKLAALTTDIQGAAQPFISAGVTNNVVAWLLMDEPGSTSMEHLAGNPTATPPMPPCPTDTAAFRLYLQGLGLQPANFGKASWTDVYPSNDSANSPRLYYYTANFRSQLLANYFKAVTDALHAVVPGAKTTANFAEELTFNGNLLYGGVDWFTILRQGALTYGWTENWLAYTATYQLSGYRADFLRSASGGQFGMYNVLKSPWDTAAVQAANIGHGAKASFDYNFGPDWSGAADGSSSNYARYPTLHKMHAAVSSVELELVNANVPRSKIALLYSHATDVWTLNDVFSDYGKERQGLFLLLRHLGYTLDIITEQDVLDGKLISGKYQGAFLTGSHFRRDAALALVAWVQNGGRLYYNAGSLTSDEFNQPLNLDGTLGIARQDYVFKQPAGRELYELPFATNNDPFTFNGTALEGIIGVQKIAGSAPGGATVMATFAADGSPAALSKACGAGQAIFCGVFPGLAYQKSGVLAMQQANTANPARATYGAPSFDAGYRLLVAAMLEGLDYRPPALTSDYLVEANLLDGPQHQIIALSNWTGESRTNLTITVQASTHFAPPYAALGTVTSSTQQQGVLTLTLNQLDEADFIVLPKRKVCCWRRAFQRQVFW
jgi:hypothetical protein